MHTHHTLYNTQAPEHNDVTDDIVTKVEVFRKSECVYYSKSLDNTSFK